MSVARGSREYKILLRRPLMVNRGVITITHNMYFRFLNCCVMRSLFEADAANGILARLNNLQPATKSLWGKMNVSQMLAHCHAPLQVALGEKQLKRRLVGLLFGRIARKSMLKPGDFTKNLPTDPGFLVKDDRDFDTAKKQLESLIQRFSEADSQSVAAKTHPFFGKMTAEEWGILQWKHLDHHLRQFGV